MKLYSLFFSVLLISNGVVLAESNLKLAPAKCVTLNQGNTCYQEINISWQVDTNGYYCLFDSLDKKPVSCWNNAKQGSHRFEFSGIQSIDYHLMRMPEKVAVASEHFSVKWVYKARPNNRWRLF